MVKSDRQEKKIADRPDPAANKIDDGIGARLREAVQQAGGIGNVSRRSGIPTRSIDKYYRDTEMSRRALVALAEACAVHVEWLATGRGEKHLPYVPAGHFEPLPKGTRISVGPSVPLPEQPPQAAAPDPALLAKAIELVDALSDGTDAADRARRIAKIYEILSAPRPKS